MKRQTSRADAANGSAAVSATHAGEPSDESLRLAFRHMHHPARGPQTFEAMRDHPVWGVCLRARARQMGRPAWQASPVATSLPPGPPVPPTPAQPPARRRADSEPINLWTRPRGIQMGPDLKRRAANDRDD